MVERRTPRSAISDSGANWAATFGECKWRQPGISRNECFARSLPARSVERRSFLTDARIARLGVLNAAREYAVLRVYAHFPDPSTGEKLWALQTRGVIEHGKISTDELELLNELGPGWLAPSLP